jgi:hypothetical protein
VITRHDPDPDGQAPFCGAGRSPLLALLVSMPSPLRSHSPLLITKCPPELVPEYPSTLFCPCARLSTALQSAHAPM